jgi:hypothetical protein
MTVGSLTVLQRTSCHLKNEQPEFYTGNYAEYEAYRQSRLGDDAQPKRTKYKKISG